MNDKASANDTAQKRVDKTSEIVHEAQRTWVGLTDGERLDLEQLADRQYADTRGQELRPSWASLFCRAIEAKLKEKNT